MHVQPYDSHAYLQAFNSRSWEPAGNTTLTDPRSQRNQVGRRGRPDNNTSSQLIRYPGLPTERAPDAPVPVAQGYSQQPEISQATGGVDGVMPDNNLIEQDHRSVKQRIAVMLGLKHFHNAAIMIAGIELMHRIRKGQFGLRSLGLQRQTAPAVWNAVLRN